MISTTSWTNQHESDFVLTNFRCLNGDSLAELRLHYTTLGVPKRDRAGEIVNGVLLLHAMLGEGKDWLIPSLANELFDKGQPLDANRYFIVLPDAIGHGNSSKPSDGLRAHFPAYRYRDIVDSQCRLITEGLRVSRLRLALGSSMGAMCTWMWGEIYPDLMDGLVPIGSQPVPLGGHNWMMRRFVIDTIRNDPDWNGGNYHKNPRQHAYASALFLLMANSFVQLQNRAPTQELGDALFRQLIEQAGRRDANDQLYAFESAIDYDPLNDLEKIKARLLAINFADDEIFSSDLGLTPQVINRVPNGEFVLVPSSRYTNGHRTHLQAAVWRPLLANFMTTIQ